MWRAVCYAVRTRMILMAFKCLRWSYIGLATRSVCSWIPVYSDARVPAFFVLLPLYVLQSTLSTDTVVGAHDFFVAQSE